ncbi:DUF4981 domain-containing protein [Streptomyces sp. APSN-46.1]|nr:DUF4981 domain-containing protein [Streptomyces sp. APSN-46.1]
MIAPVRIGPGPEAGTLAVENRYEVLDLSHLRFTWSLAREGVELAHGVLPTPELAAGQHGRLPLPGWTLPQLPLGGAPRARRTAEASSGSPSRRSWASPPTGPPKVTWSPGDSSSSPRRSAADRSACRARPAARASTFCSAQAASTGPQELCSASADFPSADHG